MERANAEEEQAAAEALQQVQAERQRDQDTHFQLHLQAQEIKVNYPLTVASLCTILCCMPCWQSRVTCHVADHLSPAETPGTTALLRCLSDYAGSAAYCDDADVCRRRRPSEFARGLCEKAM